LPKTGWHLGIVGCGLMGRSIVALARGEGIKITMVDVAQSALAVARETFADDQRVTITDQYDHLATADLIIEAVVETLAVKKTVHERIESVAGPSATIASNTSSIPLSSMENHFSSPDRFCGIHSMLNQSLRLLSQGVAVADIDAAMREFGFKAGPFEIIDIIGADTCMYAGRTMWEHKLECVSLSPILPRLVKHGRLGRKAGVGFYKYPDPRGEALVDPQLQPLLDPYQDNSKLDDAVGAKKLQSDLALQILVPVVLEATRILEQKIVGDYRDIDLAFTHGLFPQRRGGLLFWADQIGLTALVELLEQRSSDDPSLKPTALMVSMASGGQSFYSAP